MQEAGQEAGKGVTSRPIFGVLASPLELTVLIQQAAFETKLEALQAEEVFTL